jgi:hypothetical protein
VPTLIDWVGRFSTSKTLAGAPVLLSPHVATGVLHGVLAPAGLGPCIVTPMACIPERCIYFPKLCLSTSVC